jgi:hypothetical protein
MNYGKVRKECKMWVKRGEMKTEEKKQQKIKE